MMVWIVLDGRRTYFRGCILAALSTINVAVVVALASDVARANIPRDLSLDSQDESRDLEKIDELHILELACLWNRNLV